MAPCPKPKSDKNLAVLQGVEDRPLDSQFCTVSTVIASELLKKKVRDRFDT